MEEGTETDQEHPQKPHQSLKKSQNKDPEKHDLLNESNDSNPTSNPNPSKIPKIKRKTDQIPPSARDQILRRGGEIPESGGDGADRGEQEEWDLARKGSV
ncbi:unnamed protein product [Musa hybrid cultivar]